jgi:DNA primase
MRPGDAVRLWRRVSALCAKALQNSPAAVASLKEHSLDDPALIEQFEIGFGDGSLKKVLPKGGELIDDLRALGVLSENNEEAMKDYFTLPLADAFGNACGICGLRFGAHAPQEVYVPAGTQGVFNRPAIKFSRKLLITGSILDALAVWRAGFRNVAAFYGAAPSSETLDALFRATEHCEVYLCLGSGDQIALSHNLVTSLAGRAKSVHSLLWPEGVRGAYDFLLRRSPRDFEERLDPLGATLASGRLEYSQIIGPTPEGFEVQVEGRRYQLRAIETPGPARLKATIRALDGQGRFVIDTVDFCLSRSRRGFLCEAARLFKLELEVIESDLHHITQQLEAYVKNRLKEQLPIAVAVTEEHRTEGLKFGCQADLPGEILRDLEQLGVIGEKANKLISYLVMTSRKLPDPLALLILSGSGAGKSHLQDTVLSLCPEEDLIKLTSLTERALFYKGEDSLRHKVLALEELVGAKSADYAIRNLISAKKLVIESTVKNALTGKLETQVNTVRGPTAVFQTTTNPRADPETRSRFIVVSVDESPQQTRAILRAQRQNHTLEGWRQRQNRDAILRRHCAFQRLLKPLVVVNPFEPLLSYPDEQLLVRRDHPKYLNLILAVTFLHQLQRPIKHEPNLGDYIETTLDDVAIANDLAHQLFGHSLDDLSRPSRELLRLIAEHVASKNAANSSDKVVFTRRGLRETLKWSDTRLRIHLKELVELEYIVPLSGRFGQTYHYRLVYSPTDESGKFLAGLKSVEQLRQEASLAGGVTNLALSSHLPRCEVETAAPPCGTNGLTTTPSNLAPLPG